MKRRDGEPNGSSEAKQISSTKMCWDKVISEI